MVARFLQSHNVPFFYDDYSAVDLWGKNLYTHLIEVYSKAERYLVPNAKSAGNLFDVLSIRY